ncbi:MAG TPA: biopolymer transporter ExbD, partial [Bacteroidales bacterium]|nr:biopolymer transporter ExbD [Bacteroidales bacterium]
MARPVNEINAGSMADIAFLLLIFFLVTTTMDVDKGIIRRLPPPIDPTVPPPDVKERNVINILVNSRDELLVERVPGDINTLSQKVQDFIRNVENRPDMPEKSLRTVEHLGEVWISRGVVSLKNDRATSYEMYIKVQNELTAAFNEMRDDLAREKFNISYDDLPPEWVAAINEAVPVAIS